MKPSPLELLIYKLDIEHEEMSKNLFAACLSQSSRIPNKVEKFVDGLRIRYFEGELESKNSFEKFLAEMLPESLGENKSLKEASTAYWSATNIPPDEAVLVQELRIVEGEVIVTNSFQFKTSYVQAKG